LIRSTDEDIRLEQPVFTDSLGGAGPATYSTVSDKLMSKIDLDINAAGNFVFDIDLGPRYGADSLVQTTTVGRLQPDSIEKVGTVLRVAYNAAAPEPLQELHIWLLNPN
jgi:hypothetical protein